MQRAPWFTKNDHQKVWSSTKDKKNWLGKLGKLIIQCIKGSVACKLAWQLSIEFEDSKLENRDLILIHNSSFEIEKIDYKTEPISL